MNLRIFACGDVMTGRGIDQILPSPSKPRIYEDFLKDARDYIQLAETRNGAIPRAVPWEYIWGEALTALKRRGPSLRICNLETALTTSESAWPEKGINYRMHPENVPALSAIPMDLCSLANNHILDWGYEGLDETLATLTEAKILFAGAGMNQNLAERPAVLETADKTRVLFFAVGFGSSGIPEEWAAKGNHPGVYRLDEPNPASVLQLANNIARHRQLGDFVIVSLHWGSNWGYQVPRSFQNFARSLIDTAGVALVHGHSSHHPRPLEVYKGQPILYGCGDFLNDYEGISGYEEFRGDLSLMYFLDFDSRTALLKEIELIPLQIRNFSLHHVTDADRRWHFQTLSKEFDRFGSQLKLDASGTMKVVLQEAAIFSRK